MSRLLVACGLCLMVVVPSFQASRPIRSHSVEMAKSSDLSLPWICDAHRCQAKAEDNTTNILLLEKKAEGCELSEVGDVKGKSPKPTVFRGRHLGANELMNEAHRKCEEEGLTNQFLIDASHLPCDSMDEKELARLGTKHSYQRLRTIVHRMYYSTPLYMRYGYVPCLASSKKKFWPQGIKDTSGALLREPFCDSLAFLRSVTVAAIRMEARRPDCYFFYAGNGLELLDSTPALEDVPCEEDSLLGACFLKQRESGGCAAQASVQAKLMNMQAQNAQTLGDFFRPTKDFFDEDGKPKTADYMEDPEPFVDFSFGVEEAKETCPIAYHGGRILSVSQFCRSSGSGADSAKEVEFCPGL